MTSFSRRPFARVLAATALAATLAIGPTAVTEDMLLGGTQLIGVASAQATDPNLAQTVTDEETFAPRGEEHTFTRGHADLGVRLDEGEKPAPDGVALMLRDDSTENPVWRYLEDVVFTVDGKAKQSLPEDGAYDFTGAGPGQEVYVLPQTEVQGVPWLGWNTQSPALIEEAKQGVTLQYMGHQGPGQLSMFLQAGGFSEPQVLWNSASPDFQPMWVDLNTHAHANWVFTELGVHHVAVGVTVPLKDGSELSTTQILTFAVGVDASEAHASQWEGDIPQVGDKPAADASPSSEADSPEQGVPWLIVGAGALMLFGAVVLGGLALSSRKARTEAEREAVGE